MIMQITTSKSALLSTQKTEIKYAAIAVGLLCVMFIFAHTPPALILEQNLTALMQAVVSWGAIGVVLFAFAANAAYFINIPYTILMLIVAATYGLLNARLWLAVATGLGAAAGASLSYLVIYKLAQSAGAPTDGGNGKISQLMRKHPRLAPAAVFLAALTPLPDDPIYAYLAYTGYPLRKLALPLFTGKVLHALSLIMVLGLFAPDQLNIGFASLFPLLILTLVFGLYRMEKSKTR
jgi:hypothetical protein